MNKFVDFEVEEIPARDDYVYDIEMSDSSQPWFYANEILLHNSVYISLRSLIDSGKVPVFADESGNVSIEAHQYVNRLTEYLNQKIIEWAKKSFNSVDCRLVFKRESICDVGLFLEKKRYVMRVLDEEGFKLNKFKYTGVDVVRTTMPGPVKPHVKNIIETMLLGQSQSKTDAAVKAAYDVFTALPVEDIAFVVGLSSFDDYAPKCNGFETIKGMPVHAKAGYYYNQIIKDLKIDNRMPEVTQGDKLRWLYVKKSNRYGISVIGFKDTFSKEFHDIFQVDYEIMFNKIIFSVVERFYRAVNWHARKPNEQIKTDLFDLFS